MNSIIFLLGLLGLTAHAICPPGSFLTAGTCIPCPPGSFGNTANRSSCTFCSPGTFIRQSGTTFGCSDCPSNTYSLRGSSDCLPCSEGLVSSSGSSSCTVCSPGSQVDSRGCSACGPGFFNPLFGGVCRRCPPGMSSARGSTECEPCPVGTVPDPDGNYETGKVACRRCPPSMFVTIAGSDVCNLCSPGTIADDDGAGCVPCPAGTFRLSLTSESCDACPPGTSSLGICPAGCRDPTTGCPENTFQDADGECTACLPGERLDDERRVCIKCLPNQVSFGGASKRCFDCGPGKRPADSRTVFENALCECEPGTVNDGKGGCKPCAAGSHWYIQPAGVSQIKYKRLMYYNHPRCELCDAGFFSSMAGAVECTKCASNEYTTRDDTTKCRACPTGTMAGCDHRGCECVDESTSCAIGATLNPRGCEQMSCPLEDQFLVGRRCRSCWTDNIVAEAPIAFNPCAVCPPNSTSPAGAATVCTPCPPTFVRARAGVGSRGVGFCACPDGMGETNGVCTSCSEGEIVVDNKCIRCAAGLFAFQDFVPGCLSCSDVIENRAELDCPSGTKAVSNMFGSSSCACLGL